MDSATTVVVSFAILLVIVANYYVVRRAFYSLPENLLKREELSLQHLYETYFLDAGIDFEDWELVWTDISEVFLVPPGVVRPDDVFGVDLPFRTTFGIDDEDMLLGERFKRRARERGIDIRAVRPFKTVRDYVAALSIGAECVATGLRQP